MVKIYNIDIPVNQLIVRIVAGSTAALVTLILLVIPLMIVSSISGPIFIIKSIDAIIRQIVNPFVPAIGVIIALLVLASTLFRKSRLEGPLHIGLGLSLLLYFYVLTNGGMTRINITPQLLDLSQITEIPLKANTVISINSTFLLALVTITSLLIIVKGILLTKLGKT